MTQPIVHHPNEIKLLYLNLVPTNHDNSTYLNVFIFFEIWEDIPKKIIYFITFWFNIAR